MRQTIISAVSLLCLCLMFLFCTIIITGDVWWPLVVAIAAGSLFISYFIHAYRNRLIFEANSQGIRPAEKVEFDNWQDIDNIWVEYNWEWIPRGRRGRYVWIPYLGYITKVGILELMRLRECATAFDKVVSQIQDLSGRPIPFYKIVDGKYIPINR